MCSYPLLSMRRMWFRSVRVDVWGSPCVWTAMRNSPVVSPISMHFSGCPVILRLSQWKPKDVNARIAETPQALEQWLGVLAEAGADAFHFSQMKFWEPAFPEVDGS